MSLVEAISVFPFCEQIAAQSGQVTGGTIQCQSPQTNDFDLSWSGTWTLPPSTNYQVVGCYKPLYSRSSAPTYYSPGPVIGGPPPTKNPGTSDGTEAVVIPQTVGNNTLWGVYVWFEYGYWTKVGGSFYWTSSGILCTALYLPHPGGACFAAGTHVLTPGGSVPIEMLRPGDTILATSQDVSKEPELNRVKSLTSSNSKLLELNVAGRTIKTTPDHPFFTMENGWTRAGTLRVGDHLRSHDSSWVQVSGATYGEVTIVFNLIVDGKSSFYVGRREWGFSAQVADGCAGQNRKAHAMLDLESILGKKSVRRPRLFDVLSSKGS